jgi:hypothetical protein
MSINGQNATLSTKPGDETTIVATAAVAAAAAPLEVRYLFGDWPVPTIYGLTGLPAAPFRRKAA